MGRSEVDRRREYFKQMDLKLPRGNKHPLVSLARDCLSNDPSQRPKMVDVVGRLGEMVDQVRKNIYRCTIEQVICINIICLLTFTSYRTYGVTIHSQSLLE